MKSIRFSLLAIVLVLPLTTWQVFKGGVLTVYNGSNDTTGVYYQGAAANYDGSATLSDYQNWTPGYTIPLIGSSTQK